MKIGIYLPYNIFKHGGVQEHVEAQAKILRSRGNIVHIITPRPRLRGNNEAPENVIFIGTSTRIKTPGATSADIASATDNEAIDEALDYGYDIIHVHEPLVPIAGRQLLVRAKEKAVRVGTFHAALPGNALGKTLITTYKQYARSVLPQVDVITAVSPAAIGFITDYISDESDINYIPNGIISKNYKNTKSKRDRNMILFIGRLEKRKGARQLIKAFVKLKKIKPEVTLKIAGDGPLRKSLEQFVNLRKIPDIEFLGYIDNDLKIELLNTCGVYTSPALYGESFGIVLAEAMATGAPIVCHPNDGYKWVMKETGRLSLVDCNDPVEYANKLQLLLEDDSLRSTWQKWAAQYVKQFDYEKVVDQYEALYKEHLK